MRFDLRHGDSREVLATLDAVSVDALVTDPPAGVAFMGKEWDTFRGDTRQSEDVQTSDAAQFNRSRVRYGDSAGYGNRSPRRHFITALQPIFAECLRVLKPGAHGLVWALPRTSHWTATALEDAGFEIRDVGVHLFGTGFPKSLNLGDGRGTALKPAAEHWILVRKPLDGTVAGNVVRHGTGALNIDACRIGFAAGDGEWTSTPGRGANGAPKGTNGIYGHYGANAEPKDGIRYDSSGRWPANVTLDEEAAALLDEQSGEIATAATPHETGRYRAEGYGTGAGGFYGDRHPGNSYSDSGGASRFFYVAKPDRGERDIGCEDLPAASGGEATGRVDGSAGTQNPRAGAGRNGGARNIHPTVKSVDLMRWLCRLVTPKGGLVLDPFMGSGSTGIACAREGMRFIGIERERAYFEIARRRIVGDAPLLNQIKQLHLSGPDKEGAA